MLNNTKMKKFKHVGVAISMLFLCSCSASFTYNNLSWLSSFWVDDYVDLNKQQNKQLKKIIETTQHWHRSTQLPAYKQDIQNIKTLFNEGLKPVQLKEHVVFAKKHWRNLLEFAYLPLAELGENLTPLQRKTFINNIQEKIDEERDELNEQTFIARKKDRLEEQLEYYEQWLGKLNAEQKILIKLTNDKHQDSSELWLEYKQQRLNAAKQVFESENLTQSEFIEQLSTVIKERELYMSPELLKINDENLSLYVNLLNELNTTLSDKQRENVNERFDELIDTLDDIIEG
ncbi:DUF6279 family lipoprotein [Pseudoalteromonas sp. 20-92]|uniref:Lipoprotein n=1 Tax=Pseudoalteromonas fuliginea TaxID=1872678 RepID=A0AB73BC61_9GAMM|nr:MULTISPECIES: DUF6279 family lipoprotein [Pseudoalteromonas]ATG79847.1 hypothetical protein AOR04_20125 [Pseudoalteromonas sp. 1_2015MBL_MicDiv]KAA1156991.1 hypothetical protein EU508_18895 [Pseudoalteromonas fuliginea]MDQ2044266.1 DUF6279 family lipoprotein [Pseudoalteromonas sp. 20-92]GAA78273.1 hypothetical protein P20495_0764 [Pseudoalteromonas sp. BSi20495]